MRGAREIQRISIGVLMLLAAIAISAAYWAVFGPDTILQRDDNPRQFEALARIRRGSIYDIDGQLLVESRETDAIMIRRYHKPSTYSLVGYYSLRYGAGMAEAAFHDLLNGSDDVRSLDDLIAFRLLKHPQTGADIQLTVSADTQDSIVSALADRAGAAVAMDARTGAILALVSQPGYDPNSLDDDWDELISAAGEPFFHRALQGQYQPGSAMLMLWLAEALKARVGLDQLFDDADRLVALDGDMRVSCVLAPPGKELSIVDAFIYGCPAPFLELQSILPADALDSMTRSFALADPLVLSGFPAPEDLPTDLETAEDAGNSDLRMIGEALGQGRLTITPLRLTAIMAAVANAGSAPSPYVLAAAREPGDQRWISPAPRDTRREMISAAAANDLRQALARAWTTLGGSQATDGANVGAQIARSQSGASRQSWLYGFVESGDGAIAFVVLLEGYVDSADLITIGNELADALLGRRI